MVNIISKDNENVDYYKVGQSLDINDNIVDYDSSATHIPYNK